MASFGISIECVDHPDGFPGVVVYDDEIFPISSQQDATQGVAFPEEQDPHSSVTDSQWTCYGDGEDITMPPETARDSNGSSAAVFQRSHNGDDEDITIQGGPLETVRDSNASFISSLQLPRENEETTMECDRPETARAS